ncbi:MAG: type II secretion system protein [Lachnospiraceae bacterium]|nr:type II secretion system protein [Lachnospiraceae bacterium]
MSADVRKKSNAGFSLVELMIVVAIISVLIGVVTITYSIVGKANAKSYATTLKQAIASARSDTMGRVQNTYELIITGNADGTVDVQVGDGGNRQRIGDSKCPVDLSSDGAVVDMTPGRVFRMKFSKSDGHVTYMHFDGGAIPAFSSPGELRIQCGPDGGKQYTVHVVKQTGKVYMD